MRRKQAIAATLVPHGAQASAFDLQRAKTKSSHWRKKPGENHASEKPSLSQNLGESGHQQ
jgi:hypothetical protein